MRRMAAVLGALALGVSLTGCMLGDRVERRTLKAVNYGYTTMRISILQDAVDRYNERHPDTFYNLELNHYIDNSWNWENNLAKMKDMLAEGGEADILTVPGTYIFGELAADGYLLTLDEAVNTPRFQEEYFAPLLSQTQLDGHDYGFLVETDVQIVYLNRSVLERLGYSQEEIEGMPEQIRLGNMTMGDLEDIGRRAVEAGLCDYAMAHRPSYGVLFYMMAQQYGAFSLDETGEAVFDEERFAEMLRFFQRNAQISRREQPESWNEANDIFIQGRAAVYFGASWSIFDSVKERGGDEAKLTAQYVPALFPAVEKGGRPFTFSTTMMSAASSRCEYPEAVREIMADAYSDWEGLAQHCAENYRLPVSKTSAASQVFLDKHAVSDTMYMMDYTSYMPVRADNQIWLNAVYQAVVSVENGSGTPEEVARSFAQDLADSGIAVRGN